MQLRTPTISARAALPAAALTPLRRRWADASLRAKTLAIVVAMVAGLLALIYIPLRLFVVDSYARLEQRQVMTDVERAANALADDQADLARVAADLAARDDAYAFVRDRDPAYLARALADSTFTSSQINLLVLADEHGRVIAGQSFDPSAGRMTPLPAELRDTLPPTLLPGGAVGRSGLLALPDELMLASSHAVLTGERLGPAHGTLLVGRALDRDAVRAIAATTRLQLTIHRLDAAYPAPDVVAARDALAALPSGVVRPLGARMIAGYRLLTDMAGQPVAVLRVQSGRPVYEQGQASVAYFTMALLLATCLSGGVALELLERSVVTRQTRLSAEVLRIGAAGDLAARVAVSGGDEIARLGGAINTMLGSLELVQGERRAAYAQLAALTAQLRRSRDTLRTLFDGLDDGMALVDGDGTLLAANQRFAGLLGRAPEALVGLPLPPASGDAQPIHAAVRATLAEGRASRQRIAHDDAQGRHRVLDMQVLPLLDSAGAVEQAVVHMTDVTERLRLEAAAIQSERFAAGARLAAAVAHELNTPLQSIQSCLDLVRIAPPDQREAYLTIAQEEIRRISAILRSLLAVHRPGDGTPELLDVNALVERLLLLTSGALGDRGVYVELDLAPLPPHACARADQLTQVLLNLVMNAADAMPAGGTITISTTVRDERSAVLIKVADSGPGVPEAIRERIFDPFFTTKPEGSGLGLAICRQIIADHGGRIALGAAPGGGATFTIELPARAGDEGTR